jgi:5S rRNA maturation endonuclease (ribonuclease M5)
VPRYRDPRERSDVASGKMIGISAGLNDARLWPLDGLDHDSVLLVEGEWDAVVMRQHGFDNAITVTSGAGIFKPEWLPLFTGKTVTIIYDNDEAGRRGEQRVAAMLARADSVDVQIVHVPNLPEKGDVTDFFVEQGRSADELRALIDDATPYLIAPASADDDQPLVKVRLFEASEARLRGKRLEMPVLMSGKTTTPYTIPYKFSAKCDLSNKKFCGVCPLAEVGGERDVVLSASDPNVLQLVNVTTTQQQTALKVLAKAVPQCNRPIIEIKEAVNVEELRLIPELDTALDGGDTEYVSRTGYFLGHGLKANRSYTMVGYSHPHPKTQATVHLLSEAIPAQDNISAFSMTPDKRIALTALFGDTPEDTFAAVYEDFRLHVHRIQDRLDMQIAYDLAWHSVIGFYFNGAFVRRGWVEVMVMGDSGQGKTEMAMNLLGHYRMGSRVQGEQSSTAGLIGGLEKMGDSWMLSWGQIPLNDKRLLVVDETQGLASQQIESMSDVRATGVAEITKIRTERTNARCRLIWLANPVSGLTLSQHNQGVLSIKELFKKPEDIRRLDFALCVASGDVSLERVNVRHTEGMSAPKFPSEQCRDLVLWAWSRRPDQIEFEPGATTLILSEAIRMGRRYHSSIPLVEPSDQRLKIARLAAACAARRFSTIDGEKLLVQEADVRYVTAFLDRIYTGQAMSYGEYSDQQRKGESLDAGQETTVRQEILRWTNSASAVTFFRASRIFRKSDLTDIVGWDETEAKAQLRYLSGQGLIRHVRDGFVKTPAFIAVLRQVGGATAGELPAAAPQDEVADF